MGKGNKQLPDLKFNFFGLKIFNICFYGVNEHSVTYFLIFFWNLSSGGALGDQT